MQAGLTLTSLSLSAAFAFLQWQQAFPAHAITPEQLLFLEVISLGMHITLMVWTLHTCI